MSVKQDTLECLPLVKQLPAAAGILNLRVRHKKLVEVVAIAFEAITAADRGLLEAVPAQKGFVGAEEFGFLGSEVARLDLQQAAIGAEELGGGEVVEFGHHIISHVIGVGAPTGKTSSAHH